MTETTEIYLTTAQVATRYGLTRGRVCQLIWAGVIPARKWGRDWQVSESALAQVNWPRKRGREPGVAVDPDRELRPGPVPGLVRPRRWPRIPK